MSNCQGIKEPHQKIYDITEYIFNSNNYNYEQLSGNKRAPPENLWSQEQKRQWLDIQTENTFTKFASLVLIHLCSLPPPQLNIIKKYQRINPTCCIPYFLCNTSLKDPNLGEALGRCLRHIYVTLKYKAPPPTVHIHFHVLHELNWIPVLVCE